MGVKVGNTSRESNLAIFVKIKINKNHKYPIPFDLEFSFLGISPTTHLHILVGKMEMCRLFFAALLVLIGTNLNVNRELVKLYCSVIPWSQEKSKLYTLLCNDLHYMTKIRHS